MLTSVVVVKYVESTVTPSYPVSMRVRASAVTVVRSTWYTFVGSVVSYSVLQRKR